MIVTLEGRVHFFFQKELSISSEQRENYKIIPQVKIAIKISTHEIHLFGLWNVNAIASVVYVLMRNYKGPLQ